MKRAALIFAAAVLLAACASSRTSERGWTGHPGAQSFDTAHSSCQQISYGIEANYITCMAGRGWTKPKR